MARIPVWVLARNVTAVVFTPQTVGSDGTLSDTTPTATMAGRWRSLGISAENELEEISASDQRRKNYVPVASESSIEMAEILQLTVQDANQTNGFAVAAFGNSDYFKFVATRAGKTYTGYFVVRSYREDFTGKGAGTGALALAMIDPGSANIGYA